MADLAALLKASGHSERSVHPADLAGARTLIGRGIDPAAALGRAAILNALDHGHATLEEIESAYGEDALADVYGRTAPEDVGDHAGEGGEGDGSSAAQGPDAESEQLRRIGEADEADETGGPAESAGPDAAAVKEDAAPAEDVPAQATAEGPERLEGVAERLSAIAAELGAIAAEIAGESREEAAEEAAEPDGSRSAPVVVESADDIARAGERVDAEPSEAQKAAGNYQKAHVRFDGFDITIENPKGSIRSGLSSSGKSWQVEMPAAYGYIKRTTGADDDHVDVYLADHAKPGAAFIIDQIDPKTRAFDEHKVVLGAPTRQAARAIYDGAFSDGSGPSRIGAMTQVTTDRLRTWLRDGDQSKPFAAR